MKKYILLLLILTFAIAANSQQSRKKLPNWMKVTLKCDSMFIIESEGDKHRVITVKDGKYQDVEITYNRSTHKARIVMGRERTGGYTYKRLQSEHRSRVVTAKRDSVRLRNSRLLSRRNTPIDTSDLVVIDISPPNLTVIDIIPPNLTGRRR